MRIFVCVKQVPDTETKIQLNAEKTAIDESGIKWVVNPYDEFAIEEALQMKAKNSDCQVTAVTLGPKARAVDVLRTAMAMGADDAILIDQSNEDIDYLTAAKAIAQVIRNENGFDLVFTGKASIDSNLSGFSQSLAECLEIPHATLISEFEDGGGSYTLGREIEGGSKEVIELKGPCVIGANKGLNNPRYASLPGIMKAKKKPVKEVSFADLEISGDAPKMTFNQYELPAERPPVKYLEGEPGAQAGELAQLLLNEAKVL